MRRFMLLSCFGCLAAVLFAVYKNKYPNVIESKQDYSSHIIGIDIGDDYLQVGVVRNNVFEIIPDKQGRTVFPAYVSFPEHGGPLVGFDAKEQAFSNVQNTVYIVRSLVGRNFADPKLQKVIRDLPYKVADQDGKVKISVHTNGDDKIVSPEEVLGIMIQHLKTIAEEYLNTTITHAVIPVPYHFTANQTQAIKCAASQGGLQALRIRSEPVTIAIANYIYLKAYFGPLEYDQNIVILYDGSDKVAELSLVPIDNDVFKVIGSILIEDTRYSSSNPLEIAPVCVLAPSRFTGFIEQLLFESKTDRKDVGDIFISGPAARTAEAQAFLENYFGRWATPPMGFANEHVVVYGAAIEGYSIFSDGKSDADFPLILTF